MTESPSEPKRELDTLVGPDFQEVYRHHFGYVCHTLRRLGAQERDLEDLAHDVFIAVLRHFHEFDSSRPVRPWLFGFAYRIASDYRKLARHRREEAMPTGVQPRANGGLPDEELAAEQRRDILLRALDVMDFEKRALVVMHCLEETPVPEMATFFEVPLNTMYSRIRLARAELEKQLVKVAGGRGD